MKREIKFRAFTRTKKMIYLKEGQSMRFIHHEDGSISVNIIDTDGTGMYTDATPLEYTGRKDKNSKEIYEGDIVKDIEGELYRIWIEDGAMLYGGLNKEWDAYLRQMDISLVEVVGNIYVNTELASEKPNTIS